MSPVLVVRYPVAFRARSGSLRLRMGILAVSNSESNRKEGTMGEKLDETKGRAKEAAGDLTGDKDMEREGQMDQAGAKVKKNADAAVDKTKEAVDDVMDRDDDR